MKTAVVMHRDFNGCSIRQNSKNGFLCINDLHEAYLKQMPQFPKRIDSYMNLEQTKEFAETIREATLDEALQNTKDSCEFVSPLIEPPQVIETKRGKNGGTWAHPYLFLDFAMWLSPKFKLWAMSVVEDKLIQLRNEAGDRYKEMSQALQASGAVSPRDYAREAKMINTIVFGSHKKDARNNATQEQLDLLNKMQKFNGHLISKDISFHLREKECKNFAKLYNFIK